MTSHLSDSARSKPLRSWALAWVGAAAIGVANGVTRQAVYANRLGDRQAHQVSSITAVAAELGYARAIHRRWPLAEARQAAEVGFLWMLMTVAFEFLFGHYVGRQSWTELAEDWDLVHGRLWPLVVASIGLAPTIARSTQRRRL
jgi:hypothetical protein